MAQSLLSFSDRTELIDWLNSMDRKDLLLNALRKVYTYPVLAARKLVSILKGS